MKDVLTSDSFHFRIKRANSFRAERQAERETVASEGKFETLFPSRATSITGCDPMETSEIGGEKICPPAADVRRCLPPFEACRSRKVEPSDTDLCTALIFPVDPPGAKAVSGKLIRKRV